MARFLKVLVVIALVAVLVVGVTTTTCCDNVSTNGGTPNGDVANGGEPNGEVPNGDVPNGDLPNGDVPNGQPAQPDLTSDMGLITDCEEFDGQNFRDRDPAPVFTFRDANGQTFSLSDFQGKAVMLNFWRTDCPWCIVEMPYIQQVYDQWPADELVIITIDIGEDATKVRDFLADIDVSLPVLLDREALATMQYRVSSMPRTFFIDQDGLIRGIKFGAFQSVEELQSTLEQLLALGEGG
jgi:peroxiredoxin